MFDPETFARDTVLAISNQVGRVRARYDSNMEILGNTVGPALAVAEAIQKHLETEAKRNPFFKDLAVSVIVPQAQGTGVPTCVIKLVAPNEEAQIFVAANNQLDRSILIQGMDEDHLIEACSKSDLHMTPIEGRLHFLEGDQGPVRLVIGNLIKGFFLRQDYS